MKIPATSLFLISFFSLPCWPVLAAEVNSSWRVLGQAKIEKNSRYGTLPFQPELSIEENNAIIEAYRSRSVEAVVSIHLKSRRDWNLVNRPVRLQAGSDHFYGRVTAVMVAPDETVTVFARLEPETAPDEPIRKSFGLSGVLSIGE